jgi:hypothetical protein
VGGHCIDEIHAGVEVVTDLMLDTVEFSAIRLPDVCHAVDGRGAGSVRHAADGRAVE